MNQLIQLPKQFATRRRQVVECFVCNVKPNDQDKDFSLLVSAHIVLVCVRMYSIWLFSTHLYLVFGLVCSESVCCILVLPVMSCMCCIYVHTLF